MLSLEGSAALSQDTVVRYALSVTLCLAAAGCSGDSLIKVTVSPSATAAVNDGQTPTQLAAMVTASGAPAADGTPVTFTVASNSTASFTPFVSGTAPLQTMQVMTTGGMATVSLYDIADESVVVTITATVTPPSGTSYPIAGTTTVAFGGKCKDSFVSAPPKSLQSGVPTSITFSCESQYMGGVFAFDLGTTQLFAGNTQGCFASVNDASMQSVGGAAVQFLTEAGTLETGVQATGQHPTEITDPTGVARVQIHASAPYPVDVDPTPLDGVLINTPGGTAQTPRSWQGVDANNNKHTNNPRDGWVTMIAATPGIPGAQVFGPCTSTACPEPYVDSNDNGQWDLGEPYIDVNCNGQWDAAQQPDPKTGYVDIWTSKTIVWTDGVWLAKDCADPGCTGSGFVGFSPPNCLSNLKASSPACTAVFRFVDKNLNLYSTFLTATNNQINFTPNPSALVASPTTVALDQALDAKSLVQNPDFSVVLTDDASTSTSTGSCSVTAAGEFIFGDTAIQTNALLPLDQTFSFTATGMCAL